jgi:hypothetical protein
MKTACGYGNCALIKIYYWNRIFKNKIFILNWNSYIHKYNTLTTKVTISSPDSAFYLDDTLSLAFDSRHIFSWILTQLDWYWSILGIRYISELFSLRHSISMHEEKSPRSTGRFLRYRRVPRSWWYRCNTNWTICFHF